MKSILCIAAGLLALSLHAADSDGKAAVKAAIDKLNGKSGYTWNTVNRPGGGGGERGRMGVEGRTVKDGATLLKITFGENMSTQAAMKGDKVAVEREGAWQTPDEMEERAAWMARRLQRNRLPAGEAADLLEKSKELKSVEGAFSADLTEAGVKEILSRWRRPGQDNSDITGAKGSVKFWVKDGVLSKYEFNTQARMMMGQEERDVNRTTVVEISEVGTTKVELPEEAKKKLG